MQTSVEKITPEIAREYLEAVGAGQRIRSDRLVAQYAKTMTAGEWRTTAEPLTFDTTGALIQGQHRLAAVALSGVTQEFLVVRGAPVESFAVLDIGVKRVAHQFLSDPARKSIISAARVLWMVSQGATLAMNGGMSSKVLRTWTQMPMDAQIAYAMTWPEINEIVHRCLQVSRVTGIPARLLTAVMAQGLRSEHADHVVPALSFLQNGVGAAPGNPLYLLRERHMSGSSRALYAKSTEADRTYNIIVKAWNYYVQGLPIYHLKVSRSSLAGQEIVNRIKVVGLRDEV